DASEEWSTQGANSNQRASGLDCTVMMVEVLAGGWITVGEGEHASSHYVHPEMAPVTVCSPNGGSDLQSIWDNLDLAPASPSEPAPDTLVVPVVPQNVLTDCEKLIKLFGRKGYALAADTLESLTDENREYAATITIGGRNHDFLDIYEGEENKHEMNVHVPNPIDAFIHSHFEGGSSIFTDQDIKTLFGLYESNMIRNLNTFTYGVITEQGTFYNLIIEDEQKFEAFGQAWFSNEVKNKAFGVFYNAYGIFHSNSELKNVNNFLDFIDDYDVGVSLYEGSLTDFSAWSSLSHDSNGNLKILICDEQD
ncbi:MAG: hypothetical protein RIF46_13285, partial [Cyclobacteriaceae bacterium]